MCLWYLCSFLVTQEQFEMLPELKTPPGRRPAAVCLQLDETPIIDTSVTRRHLL